MSCLAISCRSFLRLWCCTCLTFCRGTQCRRGCPASVRRGNVRLSVRSASLTIPQSACADSSLCTREPWVRVFQRDDFAEPGSLPCVRGGGTQCRRGCPASAGRGKVRLLVRSASLTIPQSACADSSLCSREPIGWVRFSRHCLRLGNLFSLFRSSNRCRACRQAVRWT